jgi:hypothetical protein
LLDALNQYVEKLNIVLKTFKKKIDNQGRIQDFKLGGAHLKKLRRAEGSAKVFGVFRVKNHDFTPKNHIFSNCGGRRENCWGISCEKSRFYAKKSYFIQLRRDVLSVFLQFMASYYLL